MAFTVLRTQEGLQQQLTGSVFLCRNTENGSGPSSAPTDQNRQPFEVSLRPGSQARPPVLQVGGVLVGLTVVSCLGWLRTLPLLSVRLAGSLHPLHRMWTSTCSRCHRDTASLLLASSTIALRSPRSLLGPRLMMAGTLRADGKESTSLGIGMGPGSPVPASLHGGPLAGMRASPRWKGEWPEVTGEGLATTVGHTDVGGKHTPLATSLPRSLRHPQERSVALPIPSGSTLVQAPRPRACMPHGLCLPESLCNNCIQWLPPIGRRAHAVTPALGGGVRKSTPR